MTLSKQNRGKLILAVASIVGAGMVLGSNAIGAQTPVTFDPFNPSRDSTFVGPTQPLGTTTTGEDTTAGPLQPGTPTLPPVIAPARPPTRDPFRPPTRSPFAP